MDTPTHDQLVCRKCGHAIGGDWKHSYAFRCTWANCDMAKGFLCGDCIVPNQSIAPYFCVGIPLFLVFLCLCGYATSVIGEALGWYVGMPIAMVLTYGLSKTIAEKFRPFCLCPKCGSGVTGIGKVNDS